MTIATQQKILSKIAQIEADIETLEGTRVQIATEGYASATLASSGGSKSYTRLDLDKISSLLNTLKSEIAKYKTMLYGNGGIWQTTYTIYA